LCSIMFPDNVLNHWQEPRSKEPETKYKFKESKYLDSLKVAVALVRCICLLCYGGIMSKWSFIDNGNRDFVRGDDGEIVIIDAECGEDCEDWMMGNMNKTDCSNQGIIYHEWDE